MTMQPRAPHRPAPRASLDSTRRHGEPLPHSVLIDGSALFLGFRSLFEGRPLDYRALVHVLVREIPGLQPGGVVADSRWVMWTSASPQNEGQTKFLDFAGNQLHWEVRAFSPVDSYLVEPSAVLGMSGESKAASRLVRFDAGIAFAIGRLAESHQLVVITDSFGLADPLRRISRINSDPSSRPTLAFFGRGLDSRWQRVLRTEGEGAPRFIDLDDFEQELFGGAVTLRSTSPSGADEFVF